MRRRDREITSAEAVERIIAQGKVLYLAMVDEGRPYVLPMSYGYDGSALYLHCAPEGRKLDILRANPRVAFAIVTEQELLPATSPCAWSFRYRSVVGEGVVHFVQDQAEKRYGLDVLVRQYGGQGEDYPEPAVAGTTVLRVEITQISGKQAGHPESGRPEVAER